MNNNYNRIALARGSGVELFDPLSLHDRTSPCVRELASRFVLHLCTGQGHPPRLPAFLCRHVQGRRPWGLPCPGMLLFLARSFDIVRRCSMFDLLILFVSYVKRAKSSFLFPWIIQHLRKKRIWLATVLNAMRPIPMSRCHQGTLSTVPPWQGTNSNIPALTRPINQWRPDHTNT